MDVLNSSITSIYKYMKTTICFNFNLLNQIALDILCFFNI